MVGFAKHVRSTLIIIMSIGKLFRKHDEHLGMFFNEHADSDKHKKALRNKQEVKIKLSKRKCSLRARSLVVSDLRSETKGSQLESGCQLCAEVSSLQ